MKAKEENHNTYHFGFVLRPYGLISYFTLIMSTRSIRSFIRRISRFLKAWRFNWMQLKRGQGNFGKLLTFLKLFKGIRNDLQVEKDFLFYFQSLFLNFPTNQSILLGGFNLVTRVFVEKKPGFDIEAGHMLSDLRDVLGVAGLTGVRILNRYDVDGLTPEEFSLAARTILSEPNLDSVYPEDYKLPCRAFAMEYLPGQYTSGPTLPPSASSC